MANIKNIPLRKFRKWLFFIGCQDIRITGGHEIWSRSDLLRPLALQTHIDPVPPSIIKQFLSYLKVEVDDFPFTDGSFIDTGDYFQGKGRLQKRPLRYKTLAMSLIQELLAGQ